MTTPTPPLTVMPLHTRSVIALLAACLCGALAAARLASAESPGSPRTLTCPSVDGLATPLTTGRKLNGLFGCGQCHTARETSSLEASSLKEIYEDPWVLNNEITTWANKGRHRQAYVTLLGERSQRMGRILGVKKIEHDARCLACHATVPAEWLVDGEKVAEQLLAGPGKSLVLDGVSCEACHGASGDSDGVAGWQNPHWQRWAPDAENRWRFQSTERKQADHGFYDVRSPASRARMCVSCHIGDLGRGRVVTHAMYAAGHPPLPAFEVETFLRDMPPHWRLLGPDETPAAGDAIAAKGSRVTAEFIAETKDVYFAAIRKTNPRLLEALSRDYRIGFDRTRSLAVGALVTWGQGARLASELAGMSDYPLSPVEGRWPELAAFECGACHHDLKIDGWRARRRPPATPGRPLLRDWSSPLFEAVLVSLAPAEQERFAEARRFLNRATDRHPYGDPGEISTMLSRAAEAADALANRLERRPMGPKRARRLLVSIAQAGAGQRLDYESARHLVWGFDEVLRELDADRTQTRLQTPLAEAKAMFTSDLATETVRRRVDLRAPGLGEQKAWLINLDQVLQPAAVFDADRFRDKFGQLARVLADGS